MFPKIETFRSSLTPWEVFQRVYADSATCFFLDSPKHAPPNQVYSFIGMNPAFEIRLGAKRLSITGERNKKYPARKLFPVLKKIFKKNRTSFQNPHHFFSGGLVGYFGYEVAELCDKIKFRMKPAPKMPRLFRPKFGNALFCFTARGSRPLRI